MQETSVRIEQVPCSLEVDQTACEEEFMLSRKKKERKRKHSGIELHGWEGPKKKKKNLNKSSEGYEQERKDYDSSDIDAQNCVKGKEKLKHHSHLQESTEEENIKEEFFQISHVKNKKKKEKKKQKARKREYSQREELLTDGRMKDKKVSGVDAVNSITVEKKTSKRKTNEMMQEEEDNQHQDIMEKKKMKKKHEGRLKNKEMKVISRSSLEALDEEDIEQGNNLSEDQKFSSTKSKKKKKTGEDKSKEKTNGKSFAVVRTGKKTSKRKDTDQSNVAKRGNNSNKEIGLMLHSKWKLSEELRARLKEEGTVLRKGTWSKAENKILKENMNAILKEYQIRDLRTLLFPGEIDDNETRKRVKQILADIEFYKRLGEGINRTLFTIYRKAVRVFDEKNYLGSFSEEEKIELERLHDLYGNQWVKIGKIIGRSALAVNHTFLKLHDYMRGVWSTEEENLLVQAVHTLTDPDKGKSLLHWKVVSEMVGTRTADQCRHKWLQSLCWKHSEQMPKNWSQEDNLELITRLYQSKVTQECDIDWEEIARGWGEAVSPNWLRRKWTHLKKSHIHSVRRKEFEEIMDYMYSTYREKLQLPN